MPLDLRGALLLTTGIASLVVGASLLVQPGRRVAAALVLVLGGALLAAFAHARRRATAPLLPPAALGYRRLRTGERGLGAGRDRRRAAPPSLCVVAGSTFAAPLQQRIGLPRTAAGPLVIATGNAALLGRPGHPRTSVAPDLRGTAAGAVNTAAQLGTALGTAALVMIAATSPGLSVLTAGEHLARALAGLAAAATAAWLLTSDPRRAAPLTAAAKRSG